MVPSSRSSASSSRSKTTPPSAAAAQAEPAPAPGTVDPREVVTLAKGRHTWTFACDPGDEAVLLRQVSDLARKPDIPFDWFDAALVSHQLSRRLKSGLQRIDGGTTGPSR